MNSVEAIREISGVNPLKCMKCGKCSASCPSFDEMDIKPHQFVTYVINDDTVTLDEVSARLDADPDRLLNIWMDEKAPFSAFVKVLDLAKIKRAGRFVISTREVAAPQESTPVTSPATE